VERLPLPHRAKGMKPTKAQLKALRWAKIKYTDGRVPPYVFRDYRSVSRLIDAGFIEPWFGYGAPMYKFTLKGLDAMKTA
jgi:hypothetical protein